MKKSKTLNNAQITTLKLCEIQKTHKTSGNIVKNMQKTITNSKIKQQQILIDTKKNIQAIYEK